MKKLLMTMVPALLLWGCYPGGADYTDELDVVYTTYSKTYDFQSKGTYAMPDRIVVDVEKDNDGNWIPEYMNQGAADQILTMIEDNMEAYGWTRVPNNIDGELAQDADVLLMPAAIKSTTYFYSYWYDWWYGGWYGGWYGWYYPPYYTVSSYTTGSIILTMSEPADNAGTEAKWLCVGNGLYTGAYNFNRVEKAINQAFEQSPYLKIN
jgi:hypothetical protein